jgi:hypothetical protein
MKTKNLLLAMAMTFPAIHATAQTWNCGSNGGNVTATLNGNTLTISGTGAMMDFTPSEDWEKNDTPWFAYRTTINSLIIEDGITQIGDVAFMYFSAITSITIPESITYIGSAAFEDCSSLTTVNFNATNYAKKQAKYVPFGSNTPVQTVNIGNNVKIIHNNLFNYCKNLTSIVIPDNVEIIDYWAFGNCTNLQSVTIGKKCKDIYYRAFFECTNLSEITNRNPTPQSIGSNEVFYNIPNKSNITLYVPSGRGAVYKGASVWKDFKIEEKTIGAQLTSLTVSAGDLSPKFDPWVYDYKVTVPQNVGDIVLTATAEADATISGDGQKTLDFKKNSFEITVTASQETSIYTVDVVRTVDTYLLTDLSVSVGALSPVFRGSTFEYQVTVPASVENIVLTATPIAGATVSGDGEKALNIGKNTFEIMVDSPTLGSFVYMVTVTRTTSDVVLQYINASEWASGNTTVTNSGSKFSLIDRYEFNYKLTTGNFSGDLPLHFDLRNRLKSYDITISVDAYSIYNLTLFLSGITYANYGDLLFTTIYSGGKPLYTTMSYLRHAGNVIVSTGSDILSTTEINFVGSGILNALLYDPVLIGTYTTIENMSAASAATVFPNPATDHITIQGATGSIVTVSDLSGRIVYKQAMTGESETITVSSWAKGMYLVTIQTGNNKTVGKMVKK